LLLFGNAFVHRPGYATSRTGVEVTEGGSIKLLGQVCPEAEAVISSKFAGQLESIFVEVSDHVKTGQIIAQLETEALQIQLRQAEADLQSAQANGEKSRATAEAEAEARYKSALATVKRLEMTLLQAQIDAQLKPIEVQTAIQKSKAQLRLAQAKLAIAKAGPRQQQIERARVQLEDAKRNYQQQVILKKEDFTPQEQVDSAKSAYELAQAEFDLLMEGSRPEEIEIAQSEVEAAKATLALNEANMKGLPITQARLQSIKVEIDEAKAKLHLAEIETNQALWQTDLILAEANVAKAQAAVDLAKKQLADASIRSPIDGIVTTSEFHPGAMIAPNAKLFTVVDMRWVRIYTHLLEEHIPFVTQGSQAQVRHRLYPDDVFEGMVVHVSPIMEGISQTVEIVIRVENQKAKLKLGMLVQMLINPKNASDEIISVVP
jgi:membrane fusion protein (multidrug efflux system)